MNDQRIVAIGSGANIMNISEMMRLAKQLDIISGTNYRKGRVIRCSKCNLVGQMRKIDNSYICIQCYKGSKK